MRLLLVEDDNVLANALSIMLKASGIVIDHADCGEEAIELAKRYDYDLIILDLMLPDIEGYDVVRRLRLNKLSVPILILSGLSRPQAKVRGLELGADDFITKPFDKSELLARIQAIVRRSRGLAHSTITIGTLNINIDAKEVSVQDHKIHLTGKEYAILELLALRRGSVLSKELFLNHLYGGVDEPEIKIIDVFICKLRKKLHDVGIDDIIQTIWGRGYLIRSTSQEVPFNTLSLRADYDIKKSRIGYLEKP